MMLQSADRYGTEDVVSLLGGGVEVNLRITSSFARGDGLAFVVTAHGTTPNECKGIACMEVGLGNFVSIL